MLWKRCFENCALKMVWGHLSWKCFLTVFQRTVGIENLRGSRAGRLRAQKKSYFEYALKVVSWKWCIDVCVFEMVFWHLRLANDVLKLAFWKPCGYTKLDFFLGGGLNYWTFQVCERLLSSEERKIRKMHLNRFLSVQWNVGIFAIFCSAGWLGSP